MQSLRENSSDPVMRLPSGRPEIGEMVIGELGNVGRHAKNSIAIHSRRPRRLHLHRRRRTQPGALQGRSCCTLPGDGRRSTTSRLRGKRRKSSSRYVRRSVLRQVMCSAALAMSGVTRVAPEKCFVVTVGKRRDRRSWSATLPIRACLMQLFLSM